MHEEPVKVHLSPEDQKGMNITVNESVQRFPCQRRVPLQDLREITWKLPQFWHEATARGTNGNSSVFKSYFIYQPKKTTPQYGVLAVFGHKVKVVLPVSSSILSWPTSPCCTSRSKWRSDSHPLDLFSCLLKAPSRMKADLWE